MTALIRRKDPHRHDSWNIYFGDVGVGHVVRRPWVPADVDPWEWSCGLYPASHPSISAIGTAADFETAKVALFQAWTNLQSQIRASDYHKYRYQRAFTAWKDAMRDRGLPMPTAATGGRSRCFCGAEIDVRGVHDHIVTAHLERNEVRNPAALRRR